MYVHTYDASGGRNAFAEYWSLVMIAIKHKIVLLLRYIIHMHTCYDNFPK
jgi:hypothetical protein